MESENIDVFAVGEVVVVINQNSPYCGEICQVYARTFNDDSHTKAAYVVNIISRFGPVDIRLIPAAFMYDDLKKISNGELYVRTSE